MIVRRLGRIPYARGLQLQEELLSAGQEALLLLEHDPVVTAGGRADLSDLHVSLKGLASRGVEFFETGRGGQLTYHGPGQLVGYPVLDLAARGRTDLHRYLRDLEQVLIDVLAGYGIEGQRVEGRTGVWVAGEKVAAIGIRARRWWVYHGFALNRGPDLSGFDLIVPCGITDAGVTSLARLLGRTPPAEEVEERVAGHFLARFGG